jgi:hypothetical protein
MVWTNPTDWGIEQGRGITLVTCKLTNVKNVFHPIKNEVSIKN